MKIHFEDLGQDCLWWKINKQNKVVEAGPYKSSRWIGALISNNKPELKRGLQMTVIHPTAGRLIMNFKIIKVENNEKTTHKLSKF